MIYTFFIFLVFTGLTFVSVRKIDSDNNSAVFIEQVYQDLLCGQKITPKDLLFYFLLLTIVWTPLKTQVFSVL